MAWFVHVLVIVSIFEAPATFVTSGLHRIVHVQALFKIFRVTGPFRVLNRLSQNTNCDQNILAASVDGSAYLRSKPRRTVQDGCRFWASCLVGNFSQHLRIFGSEWPYAAFHQNLSKVFLSFHLNPVVAWEARYWLKETSVSNFKACKMWLRLRSGVRENSGSLQFLKDPNEGIGKNFGHSCGNNSKASQWLPPSR